jgi:endonuclease I
MSVFTRQQVARFAIAFSFFAGSFHLANAQLFPGLEGEELEIAIRNAYTPAQLLTEAQVKDTLYAVIFNQNDSVHCIYSGMAHDVPEGVDPSQWIYENGTAVNSMNLEHSWPQSKGAGKSTMGNRDMHHLYPSRTAINSDRADFPYNEISDPTTQKWYYLDMVQGNIPANNIYAYSEFRKNVFEPREQVKGDIARAMMYFWTIYRADAEAADPAFFDLQRSTLCAWTEADPADPAELNRSQRIALYQSGKENPFVLDCSLSKRMYCPAQTTCSVSSKPAQADKYDIQVFSEQDQLVIYADQPADVHLAIFNLVGQLVYEAAISTDDRISYAGRSNGIYLVHITIGNEQYVKKVFLY